MYWNTNYVTSHNKSRAKRSVPAFDRYFPGCLLRLKQIFFKLMRV
jgi:hypothetical protein